MSLESGVLGAAAEAQEKLTRAGFRFCFIGGVSLLRWGAPRFTQDIDLSLLCPFGEEAACVARLSPLFPSRIQEAAAFASQSRMFVATAANGTPIDIALAGIDFELRCFERATRYDFGGAALTTCSAEDLVVMKAFAGRDQDWADVAAIIGRQAGLAWGLIEEELKPLLALKETPAAMDRLLEVRGRAKPKPSI